jgi:hypothetical protein
MYMFLLFAGISTVADVPRDWLHVLGLHTCYNVAGGTLKLGIHLILLLLQASPLFPTSLVAGFTSGASVLAIMYLAAR